jgi:hypothetical protein
MFSGWQLCLHSLMARRFKIPYLQMILLIRKMNGLFVTMPTLIANPGKKLISVGFFPARQKSQYIDDVSITKDDVSLGGLFIVTLLGYG